MRDVLGTIQADQDAIIRAGSRGALVVDGGPGTGKTVVALHRTAYLLYSDPRLGHRRGGVLFVGPHQPYLAYVADVLPEPRRGGRADLHAAGPRSPRGRRRRSRPTRRWPGSRRPRGWWRRSSRRSGCTRSRRRKGMEVETPWADVWLSADDWAEAFDAAEPGTPHNEARDQVWEALLTILVDKHDDEEVPPSSSAGRCAQNDDLRAPSTAAWPLLEPTDLVGDLWSVPAYLRRCAPWLERPTRSGRCSATTPQAWTVVGPAAARRRPAAARRPRGLAAPARREAAARRRARARWRGSSTT